MSKSPSPEKRLKWEKKIREQINSGLSVTRWCRENQKLFLPEKQGFIKKKSLILLS
ncbi:MAG: hypothetical protein WCP39_01560 [Chlamydiota bacterium]